MHLKLKKPPIRIWIALMVFFSCFITYVIRIHFSILIVPMVKAKEGKNDQPYCLIEKNKTIEQHPTSYEQEDYGPRYEWNQYIQAQLLGAYSYGHIISSIPGGFIAEKFGPFNAIFYSNIASAICVALMVVGASWHWSAVFILRLLIGIFGGVLYPGVQCLIAKWAPPKEKSKFVGLMMGNTIGSVVTLPLMGALTQDYGYATSYYTCASMVLVFCIVFWILVSDDPGSHKWITEKEKNYIITSQGGSVNSSKIKVTPPYIDFVKNLPFLCLVIAHIGNMWGLYMQITVIPKFMAEVLGFDLKKSGTLAAMPYLARFFFGLIFGFIGDFLKGRNVSTTITRKGFTVFSHIVPGIFLCLLYLSGCNWIITVSILIISLAFNGAVVETVLQNPHDLAPNFAGTIYGIMQTVAGIDGFVVPTIVAALTAEQNTIDQWKYAFFIGGGVYILTGIIYMIFGSGELQHYNEIKKDESENQNDLTKITEIDVKL